MESSRMHAPKCALWAVGVPLYRQRRDLAKKERWYLSFIPPPRGGCCQPKPSNLVRRTGSSTLLKGRIHGRSFTAMVFELHSAAKRWLLLTRAKQYCPEDGIFRPLKLRIHGHSFATMVFGIVLCAVIAFVQRFLHSPACLSSAPELRRSRWLLRGQNSAFMGTCRASRVMCSGRQVGRPS